MLTGHAFITAEAISLENSALWKTQDKTFDMWICPLVYGLIGYCDDIVFRYLLLTCIPSHLVTSKPFSFAREFSNLKFPCLFRLCQDVVLAKSEVAELLFPSVMVNLAGRKDLDVDLCKLISFQVVFNIILIDI